MAMRAAVLPGPARLRGLGAAAGSVSRQALASSAGTGEFRDPTTSSTEQKSGSGESEDLAPTPNKLKGFVLYGRHNEPWRDPLQRVGDYDEIQATEGGLTPFERQVQAARCMDCGTPFCQTETGCPVHNLIPEWNELVHKEQWVDAVKRLHKTNNFPEFTGRVCPAPCESFCVAGLATGQPVTIKQIEYAIADKGWEMGIIRPRPPHTRTGKRVAIVGSGPAGLAAADELNKLGHTVTVFERDNHPGGLLTYGIPNMKLEKETVFRRLDLMRAEGIAFVTGTAVGDEDGVRAADLHEEFDAVVAAVGATKPRDLPAPGRDLRNIHFAMEFLTSAQKRLFVSRHEMVDSHYGHHVDVAGKHVVVVGGGDTGTDCIATSLRQHCASVTNLELVPPPPETRAPHNPWPEFAHVFKTDYGHQEATAVQGADPRMFATLTEAFVDDGSGAVAGIDAVRVRWSHGDSSGFQRVPGSEHRLRADVVLLALGFERPDHALAEALRIPVDASGNFTSAHGGSGAADGVFVAGDCRRGQSLVVWAIHEGREAAREVAQYLGAGQSLRADVRDASDTIAAQGARLDVGA